MKTYCLIKATAPSDVFVLGTVYKFSYILSLSKDKKIIIKILIMCMYAVDVLPNDKYIVCIYSSELQFDTKVKNILVKRDTNIPSKITAISMSSHNTEQSCHAALRWRLHCRRLNTGCYEDKFGLGRLLWHCQYAQRC